MNNNINYTFDLLLKKYMDKSWSIHVLNVGMEIF